ncbi:carboxylic acid reductase [Nocardia sp. CNY236]|uniref:carboxylic acid reductase n=1 Tax=Nocardia sp. CNY236 TaxID=1169152 RepID=UPI0004070236|nr:carboxylic acid reductase [Nocardia sp. CNY236]
MLETQSEQLERRLAELNAKYDDIRAVQPDKEILEEIRTPGLGLAQIIETVMTKYADRPALGQRATEVRVEESTGRAALTLLPWYETITYAALWERACALAAAWHRDVENPMQAGDFVAMLGFTSSDYTTLDLACLHLGLVAVPLQSSASVAQLTAIAEEAAPRVLAATPELLDVAVQCVLSAPVLRLVVFDYHPDDDDQRAAVEAARARLASEGNPAQVELLTDVISRGRRLPPAPAYEPEPGENPLALLIYTSGSTGTPKGAMYPRDLITAWWQFSPAEWLGEPDIPAINVNYMPMSHIAGRSFQTTVLARGGTAYFAAKSDMSTLFEDIALIRPTELFMVPRVCDMVFQHFQSELNRRAGRDGRRGELEAEVEADMRERFFGGRVLAATCGSAPLSAEMRSFVESILDMPLHDGYGTTESGGGIVVDNQVRRPPVIDYKLVDVPDLGYFGTDQPYPRGELLLKSITMIPGYYKRPEATAEVFGADGYYRTGDIVAELGPDRLAFVDRRNNVLKLSQGEFVAISNLEAIYATSPLVRQIFVYGSSERAYLLAVVVPTADAVARADSDTGKLAELKTALADSLRALAKDADLQSYEIPRDFLIETEPFTTGNGLLSGIGKLLRPKLKERYGPRLQQLYAELADGQEQELLELRTGVGDRSVLETVSQATKALLGCAGADLHPDAHFTDLGGDSLSALSFSTLLRELFGVEVPVSVVIGPSNSLREIAEYIEASRVSEDRRAATVGLRERGTQLRAADLTLDKFIDEHTLAVAPTLPRASAPARTVLLTGANGYLGRFLCLEWLERMHDSGGTVICLVRGTDPGDARRRIEAAFDSGDPTLVRHFDELAAHLEVICGDIGEPQLGLDQQTWQRLSASVDVIVHPAALVNHVLPYEQLFGPNVAGTAELIRLAMTTRLKPFTYISTVGVADGVDPAVFVEDGDIRRISPVRLVDDSYANGYSNSKWAGEVLLREAHDMCNLPVTVFRLDMLLADPRYTGQLNVQDIFTRLLLSVLATGIAPASFYRIPADGHRPRAHYDGLPVDFTAAAISALGATATTGFQSFDALNPYDDGRSLDEFVDWLIAAGYRIERIADYDEWVSRLETALRALPERQRRASALPVLQAYRHPAPALCGSVISAEKFRSAVQAADINAEHDIPHVSHELIEKYATDLKSLSLL